LILLGPPGAGKGTQAEVLSKKLGVPAISTGDILRDAVRRETPVGVKAKEYMDAGALVPDDVIIGLTIDRITMHDCGNGYILDGVPRTIAQAQALDSQGAGIDAVLSIEVSDEDITKRLGGRRSCPVCNAVFHIQSKPPAAEGICDICGAELVIRKDDQPETILFRLDTYHKETEPLKSYYEDQGKLRYVNSVSGVAETTAEALKALGI
jgi:adenylate kinase